MGKAVDITGIKFNRLTAVRFLRKDRHYNQIWAFYCICGNKVEASKASVMSGKTTSCGCYHREIMKGSKMNLKHGKHNTRIYNIWRGIHFRTTNKNSSNFANYGGRGINVCKRWKKFGNFFIDMGDSYREDLTIDRIDNNKGYSKSNCRWATTKDQSRNRRNVIIFNNLTAREGSLLLGGNEGLVSERVSAGWNLERAFTQKIKRQ